MSKSIRPKNNVYLDSRSIVHNRENLFNILNHSPKLVYADMITHNTTKEYELTNGSSLYLVIAHTNGGDSALFDIVMYKGEYTTRIHDDRYLTVVYENNKVKITGLYTTYVRIIELPNA